MAIRHTVAATTPIAIGMIISMMTSTISMTMLTANSTMNMLRLMRRGFRDGIIVSCTGSYATIIIMNTVS